MATSKVYLRGLTRFNVYNLLLCPGSVTLDIAGRGLIVDGWLRLREQARIGVLISRLRMTLDNVLARKIEDPASNLSDNEVVRIVRK